MIYLLLKHNLIPNFAYKFALRFTNFEQRMGLMSINVKKAAE
jgi:hypothetical protein